MAEIPDQQSQDAIFESLETLSRADEYYDWLYSRMKPFIKGTVLEIGAGIGTFGQYPAKNVPDYHVSDYDERFVKILSQKFSHAFQWDLYKPFPGTQQYDTVIILNVVEHLQDDVIALQNIKSILKPDGHLIIMVPAMPFLYGSMDKSFGHYRRYTKSSMKDLLPRVPLTLVKQEYVNVVGMFGWFLYGRILKADNLPSQLCSRFNLMIPLLKIERPLAALAGLSLISITKNA